MKMDFTTTSLYNHFINPFVNLGKQNCKTYGDIFYINNGNIEPNGPIALAILLNYFGIDTSQILIINVQHKINILYRIYEGLIKYKYCNEYLLDKCLKFNRLDELIKEKYKFNKSEYYNDLIENSIYIGKTFAFYKNNTNGDLIDNENNIIYNNFKIFNDDHCPSCNCNGFITKNLSVSCIGIVPDCKKCYIPICINCAYIDDENEPWSRICSICCQNKYNPTKSLNTNILHKIKNHKFYDFNRFGIEGNIDKEYIVELLKKQNNKCYICQEEVLINNWNPYCCYQFSIDRIKNNEPHNKNNVLISCYYCNCRHHPKFNQHNKICNRGCHMEKKFLRDKNDISKDDIDKIFNDIK